MPGFWNAKQLNDSERNCSDLLALESAGEILMDFQCFKFSVSDSDYFRFWDFSISGFSYFRKLAFT